MRKTVFLTKKIPPRKSYVLLWPSTFLFWRHVKKIFNRNYLNKLKISIKLFKLKKLTNATLHLGNKIDVFCCILAKKLRLPSTKKLCIFHLSLKVSILLNVVYFRTLITSKYTKFATFRSKFCCFSEFSRHRTLRIIPTRYTDPKSRSNYFDFRRPSPKQPDTASIHRPIKVRDQQHPVHFSYEPFSSNIN